MVKIKIHSFVDVITNSSTVIFVDSTGCIEPFKKMVDAFCKSVGIDDRVDDMFGFGVFHGCDAYTDYIDDNYSDLGAEAKRIHDLDWNDAKLEVERLIAGICRGDMEMPKWLMDAKDEMFRLSRDSHLYIIPKSDRYKDLAKSIENFLYSPEHDAEWDG